MRSESDGDLCMCACHTNHSVGCIILVPRAYDPSGLRQESRALGNHFEITKEITEFCPSGLTQSSSMAHAQNGCSQSSRFLPQARRIVGSGDENGVVSKNKSNCLLENEVMSIFI